MNHHTTTLYFLIAATATLALFAANILFGSVGIPIADSFSIITGSTGDVSPAWRYIIMESRLPQALTATLCGASLAISGLMLQSAFRNPLAGPSMFGINSGASLGVAVVILLLNGSIASEMLSASGFAAIILGAMTGSAIVIASLLAVSRFIKSNTTILIIGLMIGYLASSAISLLNFFATQQGVTSYVMWGMGNFNNVSMRHMPVFATSTIVCLAMSLLLIKPLDSLLLGERYAQNLGVNTTWVRNMLLLITGTQTAVTTAYCGPIAFIGLAVPHITRMFLRTDRHLILMPATIMTGAAIALACNLACALPGDDGIIPLNAVTPIIGAPVIIYVIIKNRG